MKHNAEYEVVLLAAGCSRRLAHLTREVPKSFLTVGGQRIIDRTLSILEANGLERVTAIVGYRKEAFHREIGASRGRVSLRYVDSPDFETTGHAWSLFQARDLLLREDRPVIVLHADIVYDPEILTAVLRCEFEDIIAADDRFVRRTNDEVVVCGTADGIKRIEKVSQSPRDVIGEVVGINKWSAALVRDLFAFMSRFFDTHGPNYNWEPVVDSFLRESGHAVRALETKGLPWVNVNYEDDLALAEEVVRSAPIGPRAQP